MNHVILQKGARTVTRQELDRVEVPPPTASWFPIAHARVFDRVCDTVSSAGFLIRGTHLALSRGNSKFFATIDLDCPLAPGVHLAVGTRNSIDRSLPVSFCAGHRVLLCDNLAFSSEVVVVRKHTRHGETRFHEAIANAVESLRQFKDAEAARIALMERTAIEDAHADSLMLRSFEQGIVSVRQLPELIRSWREPFHDTFRPRTLWSLWNSFTTVLASVQQANPLRFSATTIALRSVFGTALGLVDDQAETVLSA